MIDKQTFEQIPVTDLLGVCNVKNVSLRIDGGRFCIQIPPHGADVDPLVKTLIKRQREVLEELVAEISKRVPLVVPCSVVDLLGDEIPLDDWKLAT